jgi:hypothetical protein
MLCLTSGGVVSACGNNDNIQPSPMIISGLATELVCAVSIPPNWPGIEFKDASEPSEKARGKSLNGSLFNERAFGE